MLTVGIVVVVELIIPSAILVEEVNVLAVLYLEPLATCDLGKDLKTLGVG